MLHYTVTPSCPMDHIDTITINPELCRTNDRISYLDQTILRAVRYPATCRLSRDLAIVFFKYCHAKSNTVHCPTSRHSTSAHRTPSWSLPWTPPHTPPRTPPRTPPWSLPWTPPRTPPRTPPWSLPWTPPHTHPIFHPILHPILHPALHPVLHPGLQLSLSRTSTRSVMCLMLLSGLNADGQKSSCRRHTFAHRTVTYIKLTAHLFCTSLLWQQHTDHFRCV